MELLNYWELIVTALSFLCSVVVFIVYLVKRHKAVKNAKTDEEKQEAINQVKADTLGWISVAETVFSSIPKSGSSKLLYVLDHVKELCTNKDVAFDEKYWTDFVNGIVAGHNEVIDAQKEASTKAEIIDAIKKQVPFFVEDAKKLFTNIPDSSAYEIAYVLKDIATACAEYEIKVDYDWQSYVESFYKEGV